MRLHLLGTAVLWANDTAEGGSALPADFWPHLWGGLIGTAVFGLLGILLMVLGFKIFDWVLPKVDFERELVEKNNVAVAIVAAAVILGVAIVAAVALK